MLDYTVITDANIGQGLITAVVLLGTFIGAVIATIKGYKVIKPKPQSLDDDLSVYHFVLKKFELLHEEVFQLKHLGKDVSQLGEHLSQLALAIATLVELNRDRSVRVDAINNTLITINTKLGYIERDIENIKDDIRRLK